MTPCTQKREQVQISDKQARKALISAAESAADANNELVPQTDFFVIFDVEYLWAMRRVTEVIVSITT